MIFRLFSSLLKPPAFSGVPMELLPRAMVVRVKIPTPPKDVWLTKRINDIDICSRNQAKRLLDAGMIKVNGKTVWENVKVNEEHQITLSNRKDINSKKIPISEETKIWVFYKPPNFTSTLNDPYKRQTVYHFLDTTSFPRITVYTIGHLDYHSEGIMLLTNNEDLANSAEFSRSHLKRKYRLRVNGNVTWSLIDQIRKGLVSANKRYKPMYIWTKKRVQKSKNVWIDAVLDKVHPRHLRSIFERKKMHVNRLIRTSYGPYKLEGLKPGDFRETSLHLSFHRLLFKYYKEKSEKQ